MRLDELKTERRNRALAGLDRLSALEIATLMNHEDGKVTSAIRKVLPAIGKAIELVRERLEEGGRLIYVGSGTSGRIGALDSSECPPTFGTDPEMIQYMISGGGQALASADEAGEDSAEMGTSDMAARNPGKKDVVVGLAASGRTPYTIAAMTLARERGASTIAIVCNTETEMARIADIAIEAIVGPEVLTGSTRLKAGSAQKQICNMLTTGALARLGYVYGNLMVNVRLKNAKLVERGITIIQEIACVDRTIAEKTLEMAEMDVPIALVMLCARVDKVEAEQRLKRAKNRIREAIAA